MTGAANYAALEKALAVVSSKLDSLIELQKETNTVVIGQGARIASLEQNRPRCDVILTGLKDTTERHEKAIEALKARDWWTGGVVGALVTIVNLVLNSLRGGP